jgi:hypothetical protein
MNAMLAQMQSLLATINDVHISHDVNQFLVTRPDCALTDEQVLISVSNAGVELGVYIDSAVLMRLQGSNPFQQLDNANLQDFCTALEGVSHFQYLVWCMEHARTVSLLELELQAEVDKYTAAMWLLLQQTQGAFPHRLHARMFSQISFAQELDHISLQRYQEANRHAAYYCQALDRRYLRCRQRRIESWMLELRGFYRCGHHTKLQRSIH